MAGLGFTVNLMTLFALILAIGIVVDDAIIIVENSSYYIEQGMSPKEATIKAMEELTGPVMGITLALVAVFLPAAFLPGITGQIFRQFALVIAATAVISAINALTLKPVQCATWLRPRGDKRPNWFYRGFNRAFESVTKVYVGVVAWMVKRTVLMIAALRPHHRGDRLGLRSPAHRVPPHRGPGVRRPGVHPARGRRSAPVSRGRGEDLRAPRQDRRTGRMGDHRRVLGPRLRQRPERHHDVHRLQELERARQGADPGSDRLRSQPRPLRDPGSGGLRGDSAAHPRPRPDRRLPDDGGGPPKPRPERALAQHRRARSEGERQSGPARPRRDLQHAQPPGLPEHRPDQGGIPASAPAEHLRHAAGLPGLLVRQLLQQVQPGVPGLHPGRQRLSSAVRRLAAPLRSKPERRDGPVERPDPGPAGAGHRAGHPLQSLSGGVHLRVGRSGLQLRTGPRHHGAAGRGDAAGGHGVRLDLDELPGEKGRLPGVLHLRALDPSGLHGAGRALRELDVSRRGRARRAHRAGGSPPGAS